jgi:hypothetical protein
LDSSSRAKLVLYADWYYKDGVHIFRSTVQSKLKLVEGDSYPIRSRGGEGNYNSILLEFGVNTVMDMCIHDVNDMDMDEYNYHIIEEHTHIGSLCLAHINSIP